MLDEFHHRTEPELHGEAIAEQAPGRAPARDRRGPGQRLRRPAGRGPGHGRRLQGRDRGPRRHRARRRSRRPPSGSSPRATTPTASQGLFTSFRANTPWLFLDIDRDKVNTMGVSMDEVFNTLQVYLGSLYVNDFNRFGRTWQVNVQGDANFRKQIEDLKLLKIRNQRGGMVPFGAMASVERRQRPGPDHAVQHVPRRRDQRQPRRRGPARARPSTGWTRSSRRRSPRRCGSSGPSWPCSSSRPATRR